MLVDAYRELNARRLFWITLMLSGVMVISFALVGLTPKGIKVIAWEFPIPGFNTNIIEPATFYKLIFSNLGIGVWLTWGATILALVSTAGMFPEFVSSGAVELTLSKPISRLRLFLTRYLTGLLFVALQVGVFTLASFLVIGIRGGAWIPGLFWAVPIVVLFFSYLYCVCTVIGLATRSTIAALLLTVLFWLILFGLNATDAIFIQMREMSALREETLARRIENLEKRATDRIIEKRRAALAADPSAGLPPPDAPVTREEIDAENTRLPAQRERLSDERRSLEKWKRWCEILHVVRTPLPKTSDTRKILERVLIDQGELSRLRAPGDDDPVAIGETDDVRISGGDLRQRMERSERSRSMVWVLGTSAGFEVVVLAIGAVIFCRRDF
jgi:hypothetical protein